MELKEIKGLGINTIDNLKALNIHSVEELVEYYPFRYDVYEKSDLNNLEDGSNIIIDGVVESKPTVIHFKRNKNKMSFRLNAGSKLFNITIFNRAFLKNNIHVGMEITVIGKYDFKNNLIVASNLRKGLLEKTVIEPVYHSSSKITSKRISHFINKALEKAIIKDYVPEKLNKKYKLMDKEKAINYIHKPSSKTTTYEAIKKLKYEEVFLFMLKISYLKKRKDNNGLKRNLDFSEVEKIISKLPFELTKDQAKSIKDIYEDLISPHRMNRLLQGDVGSGKTAVAFVSLYINKLSGYQGALMAPTEILASQHYQNILKMFPELKVGLLTGKLKVKERKELIENIKNGEIDIVIGTHALISEDVTYNNLGLVITDEQHRFGVNQRGNLKNKGVMPDILYMSATPIPRTYALTLYGDMDISSIKTMPKGRKAVKTILMDNKDVKKYLTMMLEEIKKGHQIYVVAPLVEESEKIDLENVYKVYENMNKAFHKICKVDVLHGKMKSQEKDEIMQKFKNNEIQILVSTTVIEVGVDVPNATMMVILDSFRFGLSALHQLRGRVGRNELDSYCILVSDKETKRLEILTKTNDGFKVAEEDFLLRGSGDLFGLRQSGDMNFKLADIKKDFELFKLAKEDSQRYLESQDYYKEEYDHIKELTENINNLD